ncbi:Octopamine receptor [Eumeta japonica]|uniref:Octopamine receptor n=1 Tax=Eumeta variegata TaxID=151549 RepID=A0A4C1TSJ9_EUMVA|nr:Octopamine receptor [Eumeta japonica]
MTALAERASVAGLRKCQRKFQKIGWVRSELSHRMNPARDGQTAANKWNNTEQNITELFIGNQNVGNRSYEFYEITEERDAVTEDLCQNLNGSVNLTEYKKTCLQDDYDTVEISVVIILFMLIVVTVIGNTLIISAVVTTKRLRTVTNCFVTSLAAADVLVGIFVMPPAIAVHISEKQAVTAAHGHPQPQKSQQCVSTLVGRNEISEGEGSCMVEREGGKWELGWILCDIWISLDILLCTASILSLCAISVDRYLSVTRPLTYSRRRRSKKLALTMILFVWIAAGAITCPPMLGWYEPDHNQGGVCRYNQNAGYVVFSAMGPFFLPMAVMVYVYARISCVVARRHQQLSTTSTKCHKGCGRALHFSHMSATCARKNDSQLYRNDRRGSRPLIDPHHQGTILYATHMHITKPKTSCVRTESDSNSDKISLRQSASKQTSKNSTQQSECSTHTEQKCPCCFREKKTRGKAKSNERESKFYNQNNEVTFKSNFKYKNTGRHRTHSVREHENNRVSSLRRETKTAQTLSLVVGGFVACWLPFFVYYILTPFIPSSYVNPVLMYVLTWLGWFNSAINPFIYAFYSPDFRLAFWRLTIRKCKRNKR